MCQRPVARPASHAKQCPAFHEPSSGSFFGVRPRTATRTAARKPVWAKGFRVMERTGIEQVTSGLQSRSGGSADVIWRMDTRFLTRPRSNKSAGNRMSVATALLFPAGNQSATRLDTNTTNDPSSQTLGVIRRRRRNAQSLASSKSGTFGVILLRVATRSSSAARSAGSHSKPILFIALIGRRGERRVGTEF